MNTILYNTLSVFASAVGILVTVVSFFKITDQNIENNKAKNVASLIRNGAMTFLKKEYSILLGVIAIASILIYVCSGAYAAGAYVIGALASMFAGYIGMDAATKANVLTTMAAKEKSERKAFFMALTGGSVMGFVVASLGLICIAGMLYLLGDRADFSNIITCFAVGASSIALFARVGGGIYTKAADVGADMVGKVEIGIPEDDPRNPAVIADNVGDCVGDTAGMGADIFESYVGSIVAAMVLALEDFPGKIAYITLPIVLSAIGILASALGFFATFNLQSKLSKLLHSSTYSHGSLFVSSHSLHLPMSRTSIRTSWICYTWSYDRVFNRTDN